MPQADKQKDPGTSASGSKYLCMVKLTRNAICGAVKGKSNLVRDFAGHAIDIGC